MKLEFLGIGSAHNYKEDNTSAYFIDKNELFLIDCGETVFRKLMKQELLKNKDKIHILITHTHSDHVGSLGSLITYCYYSLKQKVYIIISENKKQKEEIKNILNCFGVKEDAYELIDEKEYEGKYQTFTSINYIKTEHSSVLSCFGIMFETKEGLVFYSGDTKEIDLLKILLKEPAKINKLYLDMCNDITNVVHMYIESINEIIPDNVREKVYAMHVNNEECKKRAQELGFQIVNVSE